MAQRSLQSWSHMPPSTTSSFPRAGAGGHLACFNKNRDAIEKIASAKHERRQLEDGGVVIVEAGDLKSLSL